MSLKTAPFDRSYTTFYWSAIVHIALSGTVFSYLTLNDIMTLKPGLEVTVPAPLKLRPYGAIQI